MSKFTENQRHENYVRLGKTIRFLRQCLQDGKGITEDWIVEHKQLLKMYREVFPNLSRANLEDQFEQTFYDQAYQAEVYLSWLIKHLKDFGTPASLRMYFKLNIKLKYLTDHAFQISDEEDDLLRAFEVLALK